MEEVDGFFSQIAQATEIGSDPRITLAAFVGSIGDRWKRGLDLTSRA